MKIVTRKEAKAAGRTRYFTGAPCPKGHVSERFVCSRGCCECEIVRKRLWREANPEVVRETNRVWREANPEKHRRNNRTWYEGNPEWVKAKNSRRRAATKAGISGPEQRDWERAQRKVCLYCGVGCEDNYHVDHVTPLRKGGEHEIWNLAISCPTCNWRKHDHNPLAFIIRSIFAEEKPA